MSTNLDCRLVHLDTGWYYLLEKQYSHHEYNAFGPFDSFNEMRDHLDRYQANPGALIYDDPEDGAPRSPDAEEAELIKRARR